MVVEIRNVLDNDIVGLDYVVKEFFDCVGFDVSGCRNCMGGVVNLDY